MRSRRVFALSAVALAIALLAIATSRAAVRADDVRDGITALHWGGPLRDDPDRSHVADRALSALVGATTDSIEIAMYTFDSESVEGALLSAHDRGVDVRVVLDGDHLLSAASLQAAGIPVRSDRPGGALQHNKFAVFDGAITWTGSANFSNAGLSRSAENVLVITSTAVADLYARKFAEMFVEGKYSTADQSEDPASIAVGDATVDVVFGPSGHPSDVIAAAVGSADETVLVAANYLTHDGLALRLIEAKRRGVDVRVVVDAARIGSVGSDRDTLCAAGVDVLADNFVGVLHDKYAVIDAGASEPLVVTGSANWSGGGMETNDENVVIVHHAAIASSYANDWRYLVETTGAEATDACVQSPTTTPTRAEYPATAFLPWLRQEHGLDGLAGSLP